MSLVDLNDIRTFAAAADAGTLSGAAKELAVPPSTVGRGLTRLEKSLGVLLMQRSSRGLLLTDAGREYLQTCRRALRTLKEGGDLIESERSQPKGLIRIACPITMARDLLAPLLREFLARFPDLRVEIEPYSSGWDQEPREEVDVFFKLRAPKDSLRRVRPYPGTARGLFAARTYVQTFGTPANPDDLPAHCCIGSGVWKLSRGKNTARPNIPFKVVASDPHINLTLVVQGFGIGMLPLWMAKWPEIRNQLVPILPLWKIEPITLCALFFGESRLTPKVQVLLQFLEEYIGTTEDPRLRQRWGKEYFTPASSALLQHPLALPGSTIRPRWAVSLRPISPEKEPRKKMCRRFWAPWMQKELGGKLNREHPSPVEDAVSGSSSEKSNGRDRDRRSREKSAWLLRAFRRPPQLRVRNA